MQFTITFSWRRVNKQLPRGSLSKAAEVFKVSYSTVQRIWKRGEEYSSEIGCPANLESRMKGNVGRKPNLDSEIITKIKSLRVSDREIIEGCPMLPQ